MATDFVAGRKWRAELTADAGQGINNVVSLGGQKFLLGSSMTDLPMFPGLEHGYSTSSGVFFVSNIGDIKAKTYQIGVTFTIT